MGACCSCLSGSGASESRLQLVTFDTKRKGKEVKLAGNTISGTGAALASAALHQDAAYWEVKVKQTGTFCIGVSRKVPASELEGSIGNNKNSWGLNSNTSGVPFHEGDIVGCAYGQSERPMLAFYRNGELLADHAVQRIRGLVYPGVSVGDGTVLEANYSQSFVHPPPTGFSGIIPGASSAAALPAYAAIARFGSPPPPCPPPLHRCDHLQRLT